MSKNFIQNNPQLSLIISISVLVLLFLLLLYSFTHLRHVEEQFHKSITLSDNLRQSSDDLTRMVRTYIITRDQQYKNHFHEILDIRKGKSPRPASLNKIYWDLVSENNSRPIPFGEKISLKELMSKAGFTDEELQQLEKAKDASDSLAQIEISAMKFLEKQKLTPAEHLEAIKLVHNTTYHQQKAKIMQHISDFQSLVETRTINRINQALDITYLIYFLIALVGIYLAHVIRKLFQSKLEFVESLTFAKMKAEDANKEAVKIRNQFELFFDNAPEAYFVMSTKDGKILECNESAERMLCGDRTEIIGKRPDQLSPLHQPDGQLSIDGARIHIADVLNHGSKKFDWMHLRLNGDEFWAEVEARIGVFNDEAVFFVTWREIGDRKQLEQQKEQALINLDRKKHEQERLFAIIGHELRTPAAAMDMMIDTDNLDKRQLKEISEHLLNILNDMRAVIHPEDVIKGGLIKTTVHQVLENAIQYQERLLQEANLRLHLETEESENPLCLVNAQLLRQIILNLIKNCALHSEASDLWIKISNPRKQKCNFDIQFEDNGKGILAEHQKDMFEAFMRGDTQSDGTGLGLHLSRKFAREHLDGDLVYQDRPDGGSIFILKIKLSEAEAEAEAEAENINPFEGKHILLAEDNDFMLRITTKLLTNMLATVDAAENGSQAWELAQKNDYDLVITDIFMPKMDGYELTQKLRETGYKNPIFGVTAATVGNEIDDLNQAGANDVLKKPLDVKELSKCYTRLTTSIA